MKLWSLRSPPNAKHRLGLLIYIETHLACLGTLTSTIYDKFSLVPGLKGSVSKETVSEMLKFFIKHVDKEQISTVKG